MTHPSPPRVRASSATSVGSSLGVSKWLRRRNWLNSRAADRSSSGAGLMPIILAGPARVLNTCNSFCALFSPLCRASVRRARLPIGTRLLLRGERLHPGHVDLATGGRGELLNLQAAEHLPSVQPQHRQVHPDTEHPGLPG